MVVLSVSVVLTALIIVALNAYVTNKRLADGSSNGFIDTAMSGLSYDEGYKAGYKAAREKFNIAPPEVQVMEGTVESLGSDSLQVKATNLDTDEFVDGISNIRTVMITTSTKIFTNEYLSEEDFDTEMNKWQNNPNLPPPSPYIEKEIDSSELEEGARITVKANNNIRLESTFDAVRITIIK